MRLAIMLVLMGTVSVYGAWWKGDQLVDAPDVPNTTNPNDSTYLMDGWKQVDGSASLWIKDGEAPRLKTQQELEADAARAAAAQSLPVSMDFMGDISIPDAETGKRLSVTVADGDVVTYSGATNKNTSIAARRAIRQELQKIRSNLNVSIDAATTNIAEAQTIRDGVTNAVAALQRAVQVQTNSSTANVRSAVIDIQAQQLVLATEQRKLAAEQIDAGREQKAALQHVRDLLNQILASMKGTSTNGVP